MSQPTHDRSLLDTIPLELKFGFRMLVKYPGLTIVGGLAMAFAVWVGAVVFEMVGQFTHPSLPLPNGDRIVQIRAWDVQDAKTEPRVLHDFIVWRETLRSVVDVGAFRDATRSLAAPGIETGTVQVAEVTASAFRIASGAPVLGRVLGPDDERPGAPPVVVLGYDVWQKRFAGDARVVGRSVQLNDVFATVVGVMPAGFEFPVAHDAWMPFQIEASSTAPREGPAITVFARLAPGASLAGAQAELAVLGRRTARELPRTHEHLQLQMKPYVKMFWDPKPQDATLIYSFNVFALMLLVLICCNVALLMFARAATRQAELVVRSALGASRGRIIGQLFAEALVLGAASAAVGLGAAYVTLDRWGLRYLEFNFGRMPFWYDARLSPMTVLYAIGLTLIGAAIAGVLPALKVLRGLGARLREGSAGGGGVRFGGVWTAVIVTQVAFTVAFPAIAYVEQRQLARIKTFPAGFAAEEYLAAKLEMDSVADGRLASALETMRQRVAAEPGVLGVTYVDRLPRGEHAQRLVEFDSTQDGGIAAAPDSVAPNSVAPNSMAPNSAAPVREVNLAHIDPTYFGVLRAPVLAGRNFTPADLVGEPRTVIVDRAFVEQLLGGRNALGRRVRFVPRAWEAAKSEAERPWLEIVGVVPELGIGAPTQMGRASGLYLPSVAGHDGPVNIMVHVRGDPMSFAPRLRALPTVVDPMLRLTEMQRVDDVTSGVLWFIRLWFRVTLVLIGIALVLSLAGIYSVLAFTVARRTREIGVRVALGSDRRSVVGAIFRRPLTQVSVGVVAGGSLIGLVMLLLSVAGFEDGRIKPSFTATQIAMLVAYAAFMMGVCLLACIVPTRRALRVQPTEALRAE